MAVLAFMRIPTFAFLAIFLVSCADNHVKEKVKTSPQDSISINKPGIAAYDNNAWIENFKKFRDAVYKHDRFKAKAFFNFPISDENNEIWYLIYGDPDSLSDSITPFTEKDFDKYFNKLFSDQFIKSILKIKSEELKGKGEYQTIDIREDDQTTYHMSANFDKEASTLTLTLASNTIIKDEKGKVLDGGEFAIIYRFNIKNDGQLIFAQLALAG